MKSVLATVLVAASLIGQSASSQSTEYELGQIVVSRQQMMFDLQTAYWKLLEIKNGKSNDYEAAAEAALLMAETMSQFVLQMKPGTVRGEAPGSRAKPEVWTQFPAFTAAADAFHTKAAAVAVAAATGSLEDYVAAFDEFSEACTACHGLRPSSGGLFRLAINE
jgi:cytochrome c556